jgi:hypothetical protein
MGSPRIEHAYALVGEDAERISVILGSVNTAVRTLGNPLAASLPLGEQSGKLGA